MFCPALPQLPIDNELGPAHAFHYTQVSACWVSPQRWTLLLVVLLVCAMVLVFVALCTPTPWGAARAWRKA